MAAAQRQATNSAQQLALAQGTMQAQNIQTQQMQQQFNVSQQIMQSQNQKKMALSTAFTQLSREGQIMEIRDLYRELRNIVPELDRNDTNYKYQHFGFTNINVKDKSTKSNNSMVFNKLLDYIFSENLDSQVNINLDLQGASASAAASSSASPTETETVARAVLGMPTTTLSPIPESGRRTLPPTPVGPLGGLNTPPTTSYNPYQPTP